MSEPDVTLLPSRWSTAYADGEQLLADIVAHLQRLHELMKSPKQQDPEQDASEISSLSDRTYRWFNVVATDILPYTTFHRDYLNALLRRASAAIASRCFYDEYTVPGYDFMGTSQAAHVAHNVEHDVAPPVPRREIETVFGLVLRIIRTAIALLQIPI